MRMQGWFNICRLIYSIYDINKMKGKSHMVISIDTEKAFDKILYPSMVKMLSKTGIQGTYLKIIPFIIRQQLHSVEQGKAKSFSLRPITRQGCSLSSLLFNTMLEVFAKNNLTREKK
jgi:hypothetical protein